MYYYGLKGIKVGENFRESIHRHQQVCVWSDVSTFIPNPLRKTLAQWEKGHKLASVCECFHLGPNHTQYKTTFSYGVMEFVKTTFKMKMLT